MWDKLLYFFICHSVNSSITRWDSKRSFSILSLIKETIDYIDRILNKYNIQIVFKPPQKILKDPKNQRPSFSLQEYTKYLAPGKKVYIGKTGRMINIRMKEH